MRYRSEYELNEVIRTFENATISREAWRHAEHLTVALHYLTLYDIKTATEKMRSGIFNLLRSFGVDLTKEMPYHETMTVFWMRTIDDYRVLKNGVVIIDVANEMIATFDKDYPFNFYSRELLFSDEARFSYTEPDLNG